MNNRITNLQGRRRGIAAVYVGALLPVLIGVTAFCVDLSWLYTRRAVAQKSADAAALAGAYKLARGVPADADGSAYYYAGLPSNGDYDNTDAGETVTIGKWNNSLAANLQAVEQKNYYRVSVSRLEPTFFAGIFGSQFRQIRVGASATALYESSAEIPIKGKGTYGVAPGPVNLSLFGPNAWYNNGDRYSAKLLSNNPQTANPDYVGFDADPLKVPDAQKGYSFSINLDDFRGKSGNDRAYLQIFDPDCFNANSGVNAVAGQAIDEMRTPTGANGTIANATTTKYKLWVDLDGGGPLAEAPLESAPGSPVERSYGADGTTDMLWTDFYSADMSNIPSGAKVRLQVISTAGSSENGFDLRIDNKPAASAAIQAADRANLALPINSSKTTAEQEALKNPANRFDTNNGSTITAQGHIPINFNESGEVTMSLGNIPSTAAGGTMTITNFDTDVSNGNRPNTVFYKCDPPAPLQPAAGFQGTMSGNGQFLSFDIDLKAGYQGGNWTATYSAGAQDTSVWDMTYERPGGAPSGNIRLVK